MALSNDNIINYIKCKKLIIKPFEQEMLTSNGVDLRIGSKIARLISTDSDSKTFDTKRENLVEKWYRIYHVNNSFIVYPHERILCHTLEYLKLPNNIIGFCQLRSTFARLGLSMPPTVVDAGFEGELVIELIGGVFPIKLYFKQRLIHITFFELIAPSSSPYKGKYQGQKGLTLPKLDEIQ